MIATCHIDHILYDESILNQNEEDFSSNRVVAGGNLVENYEIAKELCIKSGEPFYKTVSNLKKGDIYK